MCGRGKKIEVHVDKLARSMLVRISNDFVREKVLERKYWYIDTPMFIIVPRTTSHVSVPSELLFMPLWAYVTRIPIDLMTQEGLCLVGDVLGLPKEMDDYTKNLTSFNLAHIKFIADLTKPLPDSLELEREDGSVFTYGVTYPWTPTTCFHCKKLGHIVIYCPKVTQQWVPVSKPSPDKYATKNEEKSKENLSNTSSGCPVFNPPQCSQVFLLQ